MEKEEEGQEFRSLEVWRKLIALKNWRTFTYVPMKSLKSTPTPWLTLLFSWRSLFNHISILCTKYSANLSYVHIKACVSFVLLTFSHWDNFTKCSLIEQFSLIFIHCFHKPSHSILLNVWNCYRNCKIALSFFVFVND